MCSCARVSVLFIIVPERMVLIATAGDVAYSICADRPALGQALGISFVLPKAASSVLAASVHTWQHSSVRRSREWWWVSEFGRWNGSTPEDGCGWEQHCSSSAEDTRCRRQCRVVGGK